MPTSAIKRSLNSETDDLLDAQCAIGEREIGIARDDEPVAVLQARRAEITAGQKSAA